jgi:single-strand DNA-binding protein
MLNKHMIIGRVGQDPELRYTQSNTAVTTVSVATSERYKDKNGEQQENTQWHRVTFWGKLAEIAGEYLKKGQLVYVEGPSETREWEDKDGVKRYTTEVKAREMKMLSSKGDGGNVPSGGGNKPAGKPSTQIPADFDDDPDGLPF